MFCFTVLKLLFIRKSEKTSVLTKRPDYFIYQNKKYIYKIQKFIKLSINIKNISFALLLIIHLIKNVLFISIVRLDNII